MRGIHIYVPLGDYVGQVRERGYRNWKTVTGNCKTAESAMSKAALKMDGMSRGRVLFIIRSGYYAPQVSMEWRR